MDKNNSLRITEIFYSIQGESVKVGLPTVFVRLTGCPLRCAYCDTSYAFQGGKKQTITEILTELSNYSTSHVTVTGGEPLAQPACIPLLTQLCDNGYQVSLETSGAMPLTNVDQRVMKIVDLKTPGSGEESKNYWGNIDCMNQRDQIKFVICDHDDYIWAKHIIDEKLADIPSEILFSPSHEQLTSTELAEWILTDQLSVRLQVQLHKYLWGDVVGK